MKPIYVNNKLVGYEEKNNGTTYIGYFNSDTPDSPFSNFYVPNKPINLYVASNRVKSTKFDGAHCGKFSSVEQIFAFGKAETFGDKHAAAKIYQTKDAYGTVYKRLGRSVQNYDNKVWQEKAPVWMETGIDAKARSDSFTKKAFEKIAKKGNNVQFVECNPYDKTWGAGIPLDDGFSNFRGENKQGQIVTNVFNDMKQFELIKQPHDDDEPEL